MELVLQLFLHIWQILVFFVTVLQTEKSKTKTSLWVVVFLDVNLPFIMTGWMGSS
jgi:hypothetical protein